MKEMKDSRRAQSVPSRRYQEQNTLKQEPQKPNNRDNEDTASEPEDQENEIQDNPFKPSNMN